MRMQLLSLCISMLFCASVSAQCWVIDSDSCSNLVTRPVTGCDSYICGILGGHAYCEPNTGGEEMQNNNPNILLPATAGIATWTYIGYVSCVKKYDCIMCELRIVNGQLALVCLKDGEGSTTEWFNAMNPGAACP